MSVLSEPDILHNTDCNLYDFIKNNTPYKESDEVFTYSSITYDYKRFTDLVEKIIRILSSIPYLEPGDKIVIGLVTCPESVALFYACNYVSLVPIMVDVRLSAMDYQKIITEAGAKTAFLADLCTSNLPLISKAPCLKDLYIVSPIESEKPVKKMFWGIACFLMGFHYLRASSHIPVVSLWKDFLEKDPGVDTKPVFTKGTADTPIMFATSGSTGDRKFVIQTSRALNLNVYYDRQRDSMSDPAVKTSLTFLPIFACAGFVSNIHMPLYHGKTVFIHQVYDFIKIEKAILKVKPNVVVGSLGMWEHFLHSKKIEGVDLSFLRYLVFSGEKCELDHINEMNRILEEHGCPTKLVQVYGMTELTIVAMQSVDDYVPASVGKPFPFVNIKILKEGTDEEVPVGETGEICVNSPGMMKGYWQNEQATAKMIRVHADGKTYLHTGDLGYINKEGYLFISGRIKNMHVSVSGTKIYTPAIEEEVQKMDGVLRSAAVVCKPAGRNDISEIMLFVEINKNSPLKKGAAGKIKTYCHDNLPMFLKPDKIVVLDKMPLTASGKIDYQDLQRRADEFAMKHKVSVINTK